MSISKTRSALYTTARLLGDLQAIRRGPTAILKRIMRKFAGRVTGRWLGKLFR